MVSRATEPMEQASVVRQKLDAVLEGLDPERVGASGEVLAEFARRLLVRGSAEFLERRRLEHTVDDVQRLFRLVEETLPEEITVRVRRLSEAGNVAAVETVMADCPFIVNTLREYVHAEGHAIQHLLHPVLSLERDRKNRIVGIGGRTAEGVRTSVVFMTIEGPLDERRRARMEADIRERLGLVRRVTSDFPAMMERGRTIVEELEEKKEDVPWRAGEFKEIQDLLRWLEDGSFVYLGYRAYRIEPDEKGRDWISVERGSGLGILREDMKSRYWERRPVDELAPDLRARVLGGPLLIISKTNAESPVQRRARMDYIGIKRLGPEGEVRGEHRFLGLFTARAYQQDASTIPILRGKLREILESEGVTKGSHDYNLIFQLFNSMPKEELFLASASELTTVINTIMETAGADEVRVSARPDALARGVNVMVILPKHRFSSEVREKIQAELVRTYEGELLNYHLALGEGDQARLHFYLDADLEEAAKVDLRRLEERVRESVRSWEERLSDALEREHAPERAHVLADRHQDDFTPEYKAATDVRTAVADIDRLESLENTGVQQVVLEPVDEGRPHAFRLKIFAPRGMFVLSDIMPTLENLGFRVLEADKYDISPSHGGMASTIHTFRVETPAAWNVERAQAEARVADALRAVQGLRAEDDRLNSLVLSAGLEWQEVAVLRAYTAYAFRIGAVASRFGGQRPLVEHPDVARRLYRIFHTLLDPAGEERRGTAVQRMVIEFHEALRSVGGIEDDRTYRRLLELVQATLRTNYFQPGFARGGQLLALKFDCRSIEVMPRPRPKYEIYLNGPRTEAAHLRMDDVARGGIRWSDRSEDFRVEVLGLVKTQQVKNAVIVPAGAKGAFIVKRSSADPEVARQEGVEGYQAFIRGLLDVTDNVVGGRIVHPSDTVVRDGTDPYLVVAADKGTARLSDTANRLSAEREFWLGDAFASGGSQGYDHKELGITARGVWECVKRHFRELGVDVESEPITVVGIGDMSGDVFGNGMLLSRRIRLIAAFDHRHIFVDPDPDPEASWKERKRLFELPSSTWADYDPAVLSEGGEVYERSAKRIELSPQARERFGVEETELNADNLIRAILRAPADLLWNGGIGTYVKAGAETHGAVGDPGNDSVRVDADELRVRVVGEGGNLGLTQLARIEYALGGGRCNTDALDNSAGVDMSDHEVNLKILLNGMIAAGRMKREDRNRLLREVTDEVVEDVLANNYGQSLAVSLDERRVREAPGEFRDALVLFEREAQLDRQLEFLPTAEELLERQEDGRSLARPELAVIMAYAKMHLKRWIHSSDLPDDPVMMDLMRHYFPPSVRAKVDERVFQEHRLRRHIVSTVLTNRFVDRMGATAHIQLVRETGRTPADVARMWYAASCISNAETIFARLRETDATASTGVQYQWYLEISDALERACLWLLTNCDHGMSIGEAVGRLGPPLAELRKGLPDLLSPESLAVLENRRSLHMADGLDEGTAAELASFQSLDELLPVAQLVRRTGLPAPLVGGVYFGLSRQIDFPWLREQLARLPTTELWLGRAAKTLSLRLEDARARISAGILARMSRTEDGGVDAALEDFQRRHSTELARMSQVVDEVRGLGAADLAALTVAVHAVDSPTLGAGDRAGADGARTDGDG